MREEDYNQCSFPGHFFEHRMTGNPDPNRWSRNGDECRVTMAGRGQEFVIPDHADAVHWAVERVVG